MAILHQLRFDEWPNAFKSECYPVLALLRKNLPNTIIPTSDPNDPLNRIGTLLQEANRQQSAGHFRDAELSIAEARRLARDNNLSAPMHSESVKSGFTTITGIPFMS